MRFLAAMLMLFALAPVAYGETGHITLLAVSESQSGYEGSLADLYLTITPGEGRVFLDTYPLSRLDTQISTRFAKEVACAFLERDCSRQDFFYRLEADTSIIAGPSAGAAISGLTAAMLSNVAVNESVALTGTINSGGLVGPVAGLKEKIEAAASGSLGLVLIPAGKRNITVDNQSFDLIAYGETLGIEVREVGDLPEVLSYLTGKQLGRQVAGIQVDESYQSIMRKLSDDLCSRRRALMEQVDAEAVLRWNQSETLLKTENLTSQAAAALAAGNYYSAASFCFGANVNARYLGILSQDVTPAELRRLQRESLRGLSDATDALSARELNTITDLQTFLVVRERLDEAQEYFLAAGALLDDAYSPDEQLDAAYSLAFGIERLDSARAWSTFFGSGKKGFVMDEQRIERSCLEKLGEAQERMQYLAMVVPIALSGVNEEIRQAEQLRERGEFPLCLFAASKAKARANVVLNVLGVEETALDKLIAAKTAAVERVVARETAKGIFPILGYSYLEYGKNLASHDQNSALLYLELSQELSNLDLYFPARSSFYFPRPTRNEVLVFFIGLLTGILVMNLRRRR